MTRRVRLGEAAGAGDRCCERFVRAFSPGSKGPGPFPIISLARATGRSAPGSFLLGCGYRSRAMGRAPRGSVRSRLTGSLQKKIALGDAGQYEGGPRVRRRLAGSPPAPSGPPVRSPVYRPRQSLAHVAWTWLTPAGIARRRAHRGSRGLFPGGLTLAVRWLTRHGRRPDLNCQNPAAGRRGFIRPTGALHLDPSCPGRPISFSSCARNAKLEVAHSKSNASAGAEPRLLACPFASSQRQKPNASGGLWQRGYTSPLGGSPHCPSCLPAPSFDERWIARIPRQIQLQTGRPRPIPNGESVELERQLAPGRKHWFLPYA